MRPDGKSESRHPLVSEWPAPPLFQNQFEIHGGIIMTYPNQKEVQVAKRTPRNADHLYSMNNLDSLRQAMSTLKGSGLKMWLYLNKNQDNYRFGLSRVDCAEWGIKKDSYYDGFNDLVKHGYLRLSKEGSNVYHFFENALAENPTSGKLESYYMDNQKYYKIIHHRLSRKRKQKKKHIKMDMLLL